MPTRSYGQIIELELIEDLKKVHKPKKQFAYQIDVTWTDSSTRRVYRLVPHVELIVYSIHLLL